MDAMAHYLENILTPALQRYGVSDSFIKYTIETIDLQASSLLRHWDDLGFRKAMLLLGSEEGFFYDPAGKNDIKCFVVVAIRNSPIETIQSDNFSSAGLTDAISNSDVKTITSGAVRYFNAKDFSALCKEVKSSTKPDLYQNIISRYPVAWSALQHLAVTSSKVVEYKKVSFDVPYQFEGYTWDMATAVGDDQDAKVKKVKSVFDGYSSEIDSPLMELLQNIAADSHGVLVVDSFKTATRNFEKLLKILEFLLTHNGAFATSNYYLENGHVERRIKLLRAAHTFAQMEKNLSQLSGVGRKHAAALKSLTDKTL